jgi:hypothetical protein
VLRLLLWGPTRRGKGLCVPLVLDDLAQAVEHAIVVVLTGGGDALLELSAGVSGEGGRMEGRLATYTRVLTTSNGYLGR